MKYRAEATYEAVGVFPLLRNLLVLIELPAQRCC
jgi:hypothetical protein